MPALLKERNRIPGNILLLILAAGFVLVNIIRANPDNDAYYLAATGRWIVENKSIPGRNVFTMHTRSGIFIQQWGCCVLNYIFLQWLGEMGLVVLSGLCSILCLAACYRFSMLFTSEKEYTLVSTCAAAFCLTGFYTTRPYLLTLTLLLAEASLLERYRRGTLPNSSLYAGAFAAGLFQSNFQCASLPYIGMVGISYMAGAFTEKDPAKRKRLLIPFCIAGFLCACGALLNPYGVRAFSYSLQGLIGVDGLGMIAEMKSPRIGTLPGILVVLAALLLSLSFPRLTGDGRKIPAFFLSLLCTIMAAIYIRCGLLLVFPVITLLPDILKKFEGKQFPKALAQVLGASFLLLGLRVATLQGTGVFYSGEDDPVAFLDTSGADQSTVRIYADMEAGSRYVWYGFQPYIDSRAEAYAPFSTGGEDIWAEYVSVLKGEADIPKFIEKYGFDYFDCRKQTPMYVYLNNNESYQKIAEGEEFAFFATAAETEGE